MISDGAGKSLGKKLCLKPDKSKMRDSETKSSLVGHDGWISLEETSCSPRFADGCFLSLMTQATLVKFLDLNGHTLSEEINFKYCTPDLFLISQVTFCH